MNFEQYVLDNADKKYSDYKEKLHEVAEESAEQGKKTADP